MPKTASRPAAPIVAGLLLVVLSAGVLARAADSPRPIPEPFRSFRLPDGWVDKFWADPAHKKLLELPAKELVALVPTQAGFRWCRCPECLGDETEDTLKWSPAKPADLTCSKCGKSFPNEKIPAKADKKVPEEVVEVRPGLRHKYPYHQPDEEDRRWPEDRVYLAAKRDHEVRELLSKAAAHAALAYRDAPDSKEGKAKAKFACLLILRFSQVYPNYAPHYDQPNEPKYLHPAAGQAPRRRGYRTGKWDWLGSLDVPLNLVIAYAMVRDSAEMVEAGAFLKDPDPRRTIERDLIRASADFTRSQAEEYSEGSLPVYRGLLAAARILDDEALLTEVNRRIEEFSRRGFYHDGLWREGSIRSHRRVIGQFENWLDPLASHLNLSSAGSAILPLARLADAGFPAAPRDESLLRASWNLPSPKVESRRPFLLGGAGVARLAVGTGADALDVEVRGQDGFGDLHFQRQAIRVSVGGTPILDDLDERPMVAAGWNLATPSHNLVVIDGLNQRESLLHARQPAEGSTFLYHAADPDFQVTTLDDPRAYPVSAKKYRQTIVVSAGKTSRYALSVFEVEGGLRHDQIFHARSAATGTWKTSAVMKQARGNLLPPNIPYVEGSKVEDGRWFVQSYGEFVDPEFAPTTRPEWAELKDAGGRGIRLHLLGDGPSNLIKASSPDTAEPGSGLAKPKRSSLIVRKFSADGSTLKSTFVTLMEPLGIPDLKAVGRVRTDGEMVLVQVESDEGVEFIAVNLTPGRAKTCRLTDGRILVTDGLAVRIRGAEIVLAGGTFASIGEQRVTARRLGGRIQAVNRAPSPTSRGWFEVPGPLTGVERLAGKVVLIRHANGITHGWTISEARDMGNGTSRLYVREEPGFSLENPDAPARFYQFPGKDYPGPHDYRIPEIAR